ncbi:MAG: hypothetical protein ACOCVF_00050 [bacterium]
MTRCKHKDISVLEIIEAGTRHYFEDGVLKHNNEYGNLIRREIECGNCNTKWRVNKSLPISLKLRLNEFDELLAKGY